MSDARTEALEWLRTFEAACRGRDFAAGRRLFAPDDQVAAIQAESPAPAAVGPSPKRKSLMRGQI